jgi:MerC mercury resistance protein
MGCVMTQAWTKWRWDGLGLSIAGLCLVHCLATTIVLAFIASAGGALLDPVIHEIGLFLAIIFGVLALGKGLWDHGFIMPAAIGALGIGMMAGALTLPHGGTEILWTILGVAVLALGHDLNHRASR